MIEAQQTLSGLVERVTFHSQETGFFVLRVKVRGQKDLITVVGNASAISAGEHIEANGIWVNNAAYGLQFQAHFLQVTPPNSLEGIKKYLGSGLIKGIGPHYAEKLVHAFAFDVFTVMEKEQEKLITVSGIGRKRAKIIAEGWAEQRAVRAIMLFLYAHGVGTSRAVRIYKTYGEKSIDVIKENPYRLAKDIRGIGFLTADTIAQKLGIEKNSLLRARAGISYALGEGLNNGNCALPLEQLLDLAEKLLQISRELIEEALQLEIYEGNVLQDKIGEKECIFLAWLYRIEEKIAEKLYTLSLVDKAWAEIETTKALREVQKKLVITLSHSQKEALALALNSKLLIITGGPGVGKTTLVKSILEILSTKDMKIALAAPTGRAAKRLEESTGFPAKTIHRMLEYDPQKNCFKHDENNPLPYDLLIVDETSMVDVLLMNSLLRALDNKTALILVGDVDQLPSVGPGQVLSDIINSACFPVVFLTEIFRQGKESKIIANAHLINKGQLPDLKNKREKSDFYFVEAEEAEKVTKVINRLVKERIPQAFGLDPLKDIQVLCPMNRGGVGARSLNISLQEALNSSMGKKVERFGWSFSLGDKVMQIENDYDKDVYNGDLGVIRALDEENKELVVDYEGKEVVYNYDDLDQLVLAYAISIHKAQGSEYPAVVIPLTTQHYPMLQKNLLYTGVTRGKKLVVLVGQKKAFALAVKKKRGLKRWSKLLEFLQTKKNPG